MLLLRNLLLSISLFMQFSANTAEVTEHLFLKNKPITNQQCVLCHEKSQFDWTQSDHSKSMATQVPNNIMEIIKKSYYFDVYKYGNSV